MSGNVAFWKSDRFVIQDITFRSRQQKKPSGESLLQRAFMTGQVSAELDRADTFRRAMI